MSEASVVSFQDAVRSRRPAPSRRLTEEELRSRQTSIPLTHCHVALDNVSFQVKTKKRRFFVFSELSVAFPVGRKIGILGHKESGKSTLVKLIKRQALPTAGRIHKGEGVSWPLSWTQFFQPRLTLAANLRFVSEVLLQTSAKHTMDLVACFCDLDTRRLQEPFANLSPPLARRVGFVMANLAGFNCFLIDGPYRGTMLDFKGEDAERFEEMAFSRDYISVCAAPKLLPSNVDLIYILYDGRLFMFEDIEVAKQTFHALPTPEAPGPKPEPDMLRSTDDGTSMEGF